MALSLPIEPAANELLESDPLALLTGMMLDQQFPMERAFGAPYELSQRLGHVPSAAELATFDEERLGEIFTGPPALHRYPKAMAKRTQEICRIIVDRYDGDTARIWTEAKDGKDLFKRLSELPGFGKQKSQIFVALLGKQFGIQPEGWREAAGGYGPAGTYKSIADVTGEDALVKVRQFKAEQKAAAKAK